MKKIKIYVTLFFMMALSSVATAQFVSPVDFMRNNPKSVDANPAFYTKDYGYFNLFLSGVNFGVQNLGLKYDNFFRFNENGQPTALLLNDGVASLRDVNYLNTYLNYDFFNCGRRTAHGYFTYSHRIREYESFSYNKDMVQLVANGNAAFLGESNPADISIGVAARLFQEFDFGYQMSLTEQLNIGVRLKFLMGFADAKTKAMNFKLYTDPDTYELELVGDAEVLGTLPYQFVMSDDGELSIVDKRFNPANLFKNYGGGIDIGAEYKFNDQWGAAVALNDLGFIRWNNYAVNFSGQLYNNPDGTLIFNGLSQEQVNSIMNDPDFAEHLIDTLMGYIHMEPQNLVDYTTGLNTNMMLRGYFDLTPENRFSAQFTGYNMGLGMKPALTLAYTGSFKDKYDVVVTYTMLPGGCDNVGLGLSANFGGLLMYVASNNVLGFFNPANRGLLNAQFGILFTSGDLRDRSTTIVIKDQDDWDEWDD